MAGVIRGGSVKQCLDGAIKGEENAKSADGLRNRRQGGGILGLSLSKMQRRGKPGYAWEIIIHYFNCCIKHGRSGKISLQQWHGVSMRLAAKEGSRWCPG